MRTWSMQCTGCNQRFEAGREEPWGFPSVPPHKAKDGSECQGANQQGIAYRPAGPVASR